MPKRDAISKNKPEMPMCFVPLLKQFNNELQQQIEGTLPRRHIYKLGYPSEALLSGGVANLPIELRADRLDIKADENYVNKHPFDLSDIKNLPEKINEPIVVFNSTKNDSAKIILTELKDKNGNNFIVAIKVKKDARSQKNSLDINSVISAYPKDRVYELLNWLKSGSKLTAWADGNKVVDFVSAQSIQQQRKMEIINTIADFIEKTGKGKKIEPLNNPSSSEDVNNGSAYKYSK